MILSVGGLMAGMHVCDRERERGHVTKSHNNAAFFSPVISSLIIGLFLGNYFKRKFEHKFGFRASSSHKH